jgi:hypothetical protein
VSGPRQPALWRGSEVAREPQRFLAGGSTPAVDDLGNDSCHTHITQESSARIPPGMDIDRYIDGTRMRLREQRDEAVIFKLTQKLPSPGSGARQRLITTIYLTAEELAVFGQLPAKQLVRLATAFHRPASMHSTAGSRD